MATYDDLSHFTYEELSHFRYIELEVLSLEQLYKLLPKDKQALPPQLAEEANDVAKRNNLPSVSDITDAVKLCTALLTLVLTATGKSNVIEVLELIKKLKTYLSSIR